MKSLIPFTVIAASASLADAQTYTNFIRQIQVNSGAEWQVPVDQEGQQLSPLAIDPGGARFELWTIDNEQVIDFLLDQRYVGSYVPQATITIISEDPYQTIPRTRADRPFTVEVDLDGMLADPSAPMAARMVKLHQHVQSYGEDGVGDDINRDDATMIAESYVDQNGKVTLTYNLTAVPGDDRSKVRGEERFTVFSLPDYMVPEQVISSKTVQIWPVADGSLSGVVDGDNLRFNTPTLTVTLNDLYPNSRTYAHAYMGAPALGTAGTIIPGTAVNINDAVPQDRVLTIEDWDQVITDSGQWTIELLTETPFGIDRLDYVTFNINRDISVNGTVTTIEISD